MNQNGIELTVKWKRTGKAAYRISSELEPEQYLGYGLRTEWPAGDNLAPA